MILILLILLIVVTFIVLLFTVNLRVKVVFDTYKTSLNMSLIWLHSFLKALVTIEDTKPMLTLYLLNKRLFKKRLGAGRRKRKLNGIKVIKSIDSSDVHVNARYGFRDPFTTGIPCGALSVASQFINIDYFSQFPDFTAGDDYIYMDASAKVNLGSTLMNLFRLKTAS